MAWSRRSFLRSGAVSGLAAAVGARAASGARPRHLITVVAEGGWDVTCCFDPKLGVPSIDGPDVDATDDPDDVEAIQTFGEIPLVVNPVKRPHVTEWFTRWHRQAHVINGIWMGAISHDPCRFRILTGTPLGTSPDLATIIGYVHGDTEPLGSLDLSGWSLAGPLAASSGRVGYQNQIKALIDPDTRVPAPLEARWTYPLFDLAPHRDAVGGWLESRAEAYRREVGDHGHNTSRIDDLLQSWSRGERFRERNEVLAGLVLGQQTGLRSQARIGVDLLQSGLCRTVTLDTTINWDTHDENVRQHEYFDALFDDLLLLASLLEERGMLDDTLVAVVSEMTRTPKRNDGLGKDHWPHTSALFFGGGIRGGVKSGATDDLLESASVDLQTGQAFADRSSGALLRYDNLAAGILSWLDVDPREWLLDVEPFRGFEP